ncbi:MAG: tRNA (adenosine(37)-N6)-threonylcarbamoyltransferase complex transferase subunit TsaD, partial [Oscillospiraceae bacterium]|nr:tRNA (adenosine(37)-N6)-threonylcarbamoyltransferase complex transferase subunit TsaD [Oscillospiraceae bacterium]
MNKDLNVLAIETSCDETSCSIVKNGRDILSNIVYSQIKTHKKFGGVVPEVASRMHVETIYTVVKEALLESSLDFSDIDLVAATYGPGLVGALLVGIQYAKGISFAINKPFIGVNHIEGHICSNYIAHKNLEPPYLGLVVSGGHTFIIFVKDYVCYEILGETKDDAAGEAYDKVARVLGYEYPGGPKIDEFSKLGNEDSIKFTRARFSNGSN